MKYFSDPLAATKKGEQTYTEVVGWFKNDRAVEISDDMSTEKYLTEIKKVKGLKELTCRFMKLEKDVDSGELGSAMEFVLDGLHQNSMLSKDIVDSKTSYKDMLDTMFSSFSKEEDEDFLEA